MFALTDKPLTPSLAASLPAGAYKLLNAARLEPGATQSRYMTLTGYSERSIRNFTRALVEVGLAERAPYPPMKSKGSTLPAEQQAAYERLGAFGVIDSAAKRLARTCSAELVEAGLRYVQSMQPRNPAGYLLWCLDNLAMWYTPPTPAPKSTESIRVIENLVIIAPAVENPETALAAPPANETLSQGASGVLVTDDNRDTVLLAYAVEAATGVDVRLDKEARETVQALQQSHYRAEEVAVFADEVFPHSDWRGRKGERPTLDTLRRGIAATRHRFIPSRPASGELLNRVQAIRDYLPDNQPIRCLADLWSEEVRRAADAEQEQVSYCLDCQRPLAMCRCAEQDRLPDYTGPEARWWQGLIGQLSVQLNRATFNCWVKPLRLIGFEGGQEADRFIIAAPNHDTKTWLEQQIVRAMVETLSKLQGRPARIEWVVEQSTDRCIYRCHQKRTSRAAFGTRLPS